MALNRRMLSKYGLCRAQPDEPGSGFSRRGPAEDSLSPLSEFLRTNSRQELHLNRIADAFLTLDGNGKPSSTRTTSDKLEYLDREGKRLIDDWNQAMRQWYKVSSHGTFSKHACQLKRDNLKMVKDEIETHLRFFHSTSLDEDEHPELSRALSICSTLLRVLTTFVDELGFLIRRYEALGILDHGKLCLTLHGLDNGQRLNDQILSDGGDRWRSGVWSPCTRLEVQGWAA